MRDQDLNAIIPLYRVRDWAYDYASIMHYNSFSDTIFNGKDLSKIASYVLVKWKGGSNSYVPPDRVTAENAEIIRPNEKPTQNDVVGLKIIYPWNPKDAPRQQG
jgi:hypothetical protein